MRILVVEDEPLLTMLLEENLAELGHELAGAAATVPQALSLLDNADIDCALLDFSLGRDQTSTPVAERLQREGKPFIYLTGHHSIDETAPQSSGPLLTKPFSLAELDGALRGLRPAG